MTTQAGKPTNKRNAKITPANLIALRAFRDFKLRTGREPSQSKLAECLGKKRSTARQHIDYLVLHGFLQKTEDETTAPWRMTCKGEEVCGRGRNSAAIQGGAR